MIIILVLCALILTITVMDDVQNVRFQPLNAVWDAFPFTRY